MQGDGVRVLRRAGATGALVHVVRRLSSRQPLAIHRIANQRCAHDRDAAHLRCHPGNAASWRTLQKAGLVPCGHLLKGSVKRTTK